LAAFAPLPAFRLENRIPALKGLPPRLNATGLKVLVGYSSKTGFTRGIAEFIGDKLRSRGLETDVRDVSTIPDAEGYDAFVFGSALYMYHWMKEARKFVLDNRGLLRNRPVWLFSSGPVGTKTTDAQGRDLLEVSGPKEVDELREAVRPLDHRVFFGGLDGSRLTGTIGFAYRLASRSQAARESMPEGDFRDWGDIEEWASSIADTLAERSLAPPP
jgi:menaquinone-dependent protoporphyrinogen oxidase